MGRKQMIIIYPHLNDCGGNLSGSWYVEYQYHIPEEPEKRKERICKGLNKGGERERRRNAEKIITEKNVCLKSDQYLKESNLTRLYADELPVTQGVAGSSPVHTAETLGSLLIIKRFYFVVLRLYCKRTQFDYPLLFGKVLPTTRKKEKFLYLCSSEKKNCMDKYRQMYNENFLGTSDVSILKFYYASFKIQQGKGDVSDVSTFLDECAKISDDTNLLLKLFGFFPLLNLCFGTGKEQKRIAEIIRTKRESVERLFLQDNVSDEDITSLLYNTSPISQPSQNQMTKEESLQLVKEYILKCYSIQGKKQLGDRIFGYLLKSEILQAHTPEERLFAWHTFIGEDITPSDTKLHANPRLNRSRIDNLTLSEHLESILDFHNEIGLEKAVAIIRKDIEKLSVKA